MEKKVRQMEPERVQANPGINQCPCEPTQRLIAECCLSIREHPSQTLAVQTPDVWIVVDVDVVVPGDEFRIEAPPVNQSGRDQKQCDYNGSDALKMHSRDLCGGCESCLVRFAGNHDGREAGGGQATVDQPKEGGQ